MGWIEAIVAAAVTNVYTDLKAALDGTQSWQTSLLNTFNPFVGKIIGKSVEQHKGFGITNSVTPDGMPVTITSIVTPEQLDKNQGIALATTAIPFVLSLLNQYVKGYRI